MNAINSRKIQIGADGCVVLGDQDLISLERDFRAVLGGAGPGPNNQCVNSACNNTGNFTCSNDFCDGTTDAGCMNRGCTRHVQE